VRTKAAHKAMGHQISEPRIRILVYIHELPRRGLLGNSYPRSCALSQGFTHNRLYRHFYPTHDMLWFDEQPLYPCFKVDYPTNDEC
jgi:hypothetical protein